jgi:uncharacterized protein with ACT and thioredoxin-like domain
MGGADAGAAAAAAVAAAAARTSRDIGNVRKRRVAIDATEILGEEMVDRAQTDTMAHY